MLTIELAEYVPPKRRKALELTPIHGRLGTEASYYRALLSLLLDAAGFVQRTILPAVTAERIFQQSMIRDSAGERMRSLFDAFRSQLGFWTELAVNTVEGLLDAEADRHTDRFVDSVRSATGIDLRGIFTRGDVDDAVALAVERNAALITGFSEDLHKKVATAITDNLIRGGSAADLRQRLTEEFGLSRKRAKLIARDQVAKLNAELTRIRQLQAGVEKYRWLTARDERVRPTHRANEGRIFSWAHPPAETGHPGTEINCRCTAIAIVELD